MAESDSECGFLDSRHCIYRFGVKDSAIYHGNWEPLWSKLLSTLPSVETQERISYWHHVAHSEIAAAPARSVKEGVENDFTSTPAQGALAQGADPVSSHNI